MGEREAERRGNQRDRNMRRIWLDGARVEDRGRAHKPGTQHPLEAGNQKE